VTLLGLGPDGHTASLFPDTAVLAERDRWAAAVMGAKSEARITLTYPALESSRRAAFLVAGEEKRAIFVRFRRGDDSLPAASLCPTGTLWLFGDAADDFPLAAALAKRLGKPVRLLNETPRSRASGSSRGEDWRSCSRSAPAPARRYSAMEC
jgi:Glucosamine-6-phosphate isomerases/6-phosphogluconolactonase